MRHRFRARGEEGAFEKLGDSLIPRARHVPVNLAAFANDVKFAEGFKIVRRQSLEGGVGVEHFEALGSGAVDGWERLVGRLGRFKDEVAAVFEQHDDADAHFRLELREPFHEQAGNFGVWSWTFR